MEMSVVFNAIVQYDLMKNDYHGYSVLWKLVSMCLCAWELAMAVKDKVMVSDR